MTAIWKFSFAWRDDPLTGLCSVQFEDYPPRSFVQAIRRGLGAIETIVIKALPQAREIEQIWFNYDDTDLVFARYGLNVSYIADSLVFPPESEFHPLNRPKGYYGANDPRIFVKPVAK